MRRISLFPWLFLGLLSCASHEGPSVPSSTAVTPVVSQESAAETVVETTQIPAKSISEFIETASPKMKYSAIAHMAYQPCVTSPTENEILYLMRAARYKEAADNALRGPSSANIPFIAVKARILSNQCSSQTPCLPAFDDIKSPNEDLIPVIEYWRIRAMNADLSFDKSMKSIETFLKSTQNTSKARELILDAGKLIEKTDGYQKDNLPVLEKLKALSGKVTKGANAFESASLLYIQMRIEEAAERHKSANQKRKQLVMHYPATQMSLWPELAREVLDNAAPAEKMSRIQRLISHFDYDNARRELSNIVHDSSIAQAIRDKAEWQLASVSMTNSEDPQLSEKIYRKWAKKTGTNREEAVFGIARSLSRQLNYPEAIKALENYDRQYPKGKYHSRSLYLRGWYYFDLRQNEKARPLLLEYAEKTNDTSVWGFYAQTFIRDERWQEAITAFEHLKHNQNPIVRGKALYWQAYAEHSLNRNENAQNRLNEIHQEFPLTWYDMLAYQREEDWFGKDAEQAFLAAFRLEKDPISDTTFYAWGYGMRLKSQPSSDLWKRIVLLSRYDALEEARALYSKNEASLLNSVSSEDRAEFRRYATHLVESYHDAWKDTSGSVRALSGTWPSRGNVRHKMAYPQPFGPLVESLSIQYGLPRFFIYGIMLQESRFRPWQVSSADAIGALQMIPKTARPIANVLDVEYHPETFFNPRVGFPYSAYYMKMHYEKWGHNLTFTAGSYNGGPHRIGPWAIRDKGKTIDFIVDEFSFDESRHYARKVAEHTLRFAYLYARNTTEWMDVVHKLFPRVVPEIEETDDWGL